jgi:KaiC/GvpD/RAD55 family RecA-like ATPase
MAHPGDTRIPFGFRALDSRFDGMPPGSAVFLTGEPDAGPDAYAHTSAAMIMLSRYEPRIFERRTRAEVATHEDLPDTVEYLTLTRSRERVLADLEATLDPKQYEVLTDHLSITDFSDQYLERTPVPQSLFAPGSEEHEVAGTDAESQAAYERLIDEISDHLEAVGDDAVVVLNSLTDLQRALEFGMDRADLIAFLVGIRRAATAWGGLTYVLYHRRAGLVRDEEDINAALDGTIYFFYDPKRTTNRRTMSVGAFRGNLDQRDQVQYDTGITDHGFTISTSQSIR